MTFRYRRLSAPNLENPSLGLDMTFGRGGRDFIIDTPEAVAQAIYTRLCLWEGEWFLNISEGTPWMQQVLGHPPTSQTDAVIRARITRTPHVIRIYDYASFYDPTERTFTVSCKVDTEFGPVDRAPPPAIISPSGALVMTLSALVGNLVVTHDATMTGDGTNLLNQ